MPLAKTSVAISKFFLFSLNSLYLSNRWFWGRPPWMVRQFYLLVFSIFSRSFALEMFLMNITSWLNPNSFTRSNTLRFFSLSVKFTYYCCNPCRVKLLSLSIIHSILFLRNFRQVSFTGSDIVAENIIVCLLILLLMNIDWTSFLNDILSSRRSHSSSTKNSTPCKGTLFILIMRCSLPGVATKIWGLRSSTANDSFSGTPPYKTSVIMPNPLEKRSNSFLIW